MRIHGRQPLAFERPRLEARPELVNEEACLMCIQCWHDLDSCRPLGFSGAGAIPYTAVLEWATWHRIDRDNTEMLLAVVRHLDVERADRLSAESKK